MTRPRALYSGPVCPNGGELRLSFAPRPTDTIFGTATRHNRRIRIWCTCLAQMDGTVPEHQWNYDYLAEIDVTESHLPVWREHCEEVRRAC